MAFSPETAAHAWKKAGGKCKCRRKSHNHKYGVCNKTLVWKNRGREGRGAWEAHHKSVSGGDGLSNCEILCRACHVGTRSYGG